MSKDNRRILVFDPQIAGVSGDMIIGALLDLGANTTSVIEAMRTPVKYLPGCKNLEIGVRDTISRGIRAKALDIKIEEEVIHRTAVELIEAASTCLQDLQLSDKAKQFALDSINALVSAEAQAHGQSVQEVNLHETASADTLSDVIGTAAALDDLGLFTDATVYSTPVAVGGGSFQFSHGSVSSPAPATIEILRSKGFLTIGGPVEAELATPTGAALLTTLVHHSVRFYPPMKPIGIGYGAGSKEFIEMPNVLRVVLGETCDFGLSSDYVYSIETNIDDATGEVIGCAMDKMLQEGAKDVIVIPTLTKKGRPGHIVKVITDFSSIERMCRILIEETGTLGVRIQACERRILARESLPVEVIVDDVKQIVNVKVARSTRGQIIQVKPEYDDVKKLADQTGKPLRELEDVVKQKAIEALM
ncbi:MAG TPA: nickel pincer cofactor biosynthesis protein LarC [Dehalococcoidia bacterium]|nr:nickel pincer cofactor biosynthesis protein LarC [Dehalococcoidia bacterium]